MHVKADSYFGISRSSKLNKYFSVQNIGGGIEKRA